MAFKNCESLYYIPELTEYCTSSILQLKKKKEIRITVCKAYKYTCKILSQSAFILKGGETEQVSFWEEKLSLLSQILPVHGITVSGTYLACLIWFDPRPSNQQWNFDIKFIQLSFVYWQRKLSWKKKMHRVKMEPRQKCLSRMHSFNQQ